MASEKNAKNRHRNIALGLIFGVITLLAGIYALRGVLIAPHVRTFLERTVEANLGLKISIGEIDGSYFSDIELKNVATVKRLTDGPLTNLKLHRLKMTYHLWDFFGGLPSFLAGSAIVMEGAQLSIDLTGEMTADDEQNALEDIVLPSILPRMDIHNSSLQVKGTGYETRFDGIFFAARSAQPGQSRFQLRVAQWSLHHPELRNISAALEAELFYSKENLIVEKLLVDKQLIVKSATIGLGGMPHQIPFEILLNLAGGQLNASGRIAAERLHVAVSGSDIDLGRIFKHLDSGNLPCGGRLALHGRLNLLLSDPRDMTGDLKVQVFNAAIQDTVFGQLVFRLLADGRYLQVEDLQLTNTANRLSISQASVPAGVVFEADLDSILRSLTVDWRLEGTNIPSLLRVAGVGFGDHADQMPPHRLILSGRMADGKLMVPEGRLDVEGGYILLKAADITLPIGEQTLKESPLAGELNVDLPEVQNLSRIFALPAMGGAIKGKISVSGTLQAPQGEVRISGRALTYRNQRLGNFSMRAKADTRRVTVEAAMLERDKDRAIVNGTFILAGKSFNNLNIELSVVDLAPYLPELFFLPGSAPKKVPDIHGGVKAAVKLDGPFTAPTGSLSLQARQMRIEGTPLGNADVDLKFSADAITVSSAVFQNLNDRLQLSGLILHRQKRLDDLRLLIEISDLSKYKNLWTPITFDVSGTLQSRLHAAGDFAYPDAELDLRLENFGFKDFQLKKGSIRLKSAGRHISIQSAEIKTDRQRLQLAGDIQRNADDTEFDITLKEGSISGQRTLLALERAATCRLFRTGRIIFDNVALAGPVGRVSINGLFNPGGPLDLRIAVSDLTGDGWFGPIFADRLQFKGLDADLRVSGQAGAPFLTVKGAVDNLGSRDIPMAFSGRFNVEYGRQVFKIHEFTWQGTKGQQVELNGTFPLDPLHSDLLAAGPIALNGRVRIDNAGVLGFIIPWAESLGGSIQSDFNLSGTWKRPRGRLHLAVNDLKRPDAIRPLPPGPYSVTADVQINADLVTLESLEAYSSGWRVQVQGQWRGAPTLPDLMGSPAPKATGQVKLAGSLNVSDLSWVAREVGGVRRLNGRLEAQGLLQGPITAPEADAVIKLSDAEIAPDFDMPSLRGLNLEAAVTPEAVDIRSLTGELGGAPFKLTGSWKFSGDTGPGPDLRLHGENLLLYRSEGSRLRADTDLTLKGPPARLELSGEVAVVDGQFSKNFGVIEGFATVGKSDSRRGFELFSIQKAPWRNMIFNVRITAKKPFIVRNNLIRGSVRPDLVLKGSGDIPLLSGNVYVESTRLYLPAGRMQLETGLVRFDQTDPERPRLDLIGTATMLGYDITAVIEGPYDEPVITLSSIPPLPNEELLMLLLTGQPPKSSTARSNATRQGLNVAVFLGRDLLTRMSDDDSGETFESIMDRFDVEIGRGITQRGEDTINSQFRVADDILVDGDSLYLTGERDYFDYYNGGIRLVFRFR
jgi:autotransporter translocation and assembly factor TamB